MTDEPNTGAERDALPVPALRYLEKSGLAILVALAVAHPALYGWIPGFADGRATLDMSLAEVLLVIPAFLLFPLAIAVMRLRGEKMSRRNFLPFLLSASLVLWVLLQIVPMPGGLADALSPHGLELLRRFSGAADAGGTRTLSLSPHDTLIGVLRLGSALSVFFAAFVLVRSRKDLLRVVVPAVSAGAVLALLGLLKSAVVLARGEPSFAFLFPLGGTGARASGPFINPNQFAGYLEILFPMSVALLAWFVSTRRREDESLRAMIGRFSGPGALVALLGMSVLLIAGGILTSLSRTGILSFLVSCALLALLLARKLGMKWRALASGGALVLAFFVYLGVEPVLDRYSLLMEDRDIDRLKAWEMGAEIAGDFPLTGTGLGTFRRVAPAYQTGELQGGYFQAHNDYVNMASDVGALGLLLILGILGTWIAATWRGLSRGGRMRPLFAAASLAAAGAMAAHSAGDFNLQVGAVAMHMALCAGLGLAASCMPDPGGVRRTKTEEGEGGEP